MARILQINADLFSYVIPIREHPRLSAGFAFMIIVQVWLRICFSQRAAKECAKCAKILLQH